jgi:hypothetical protein
MRPRLGEVLLPGSDRPVIIGEYPYYRASAHSWRVNVAELERMGVDVVSCYLPWRFHEVAHGGHVRYDFNGWSHPQRNVRGLLAMIEAAGMGALVKPGPYVHAEVQLGGLPDRVCEMSSAVAAVDLCEVPVTSQGQVLPSLFDAVMAGEVDRWLEAVSEEVVAPAAAPRGPIRAVQLGNEGTYGDGARPVFRQDASQPVRDRFASWLSAEGHGHLRASVQGDVRNWPLTLRELWSRWCGCAVLDRWDFFARHLPAGLPSVVNVPLAPVRSTEPALDGWALRTLRFASGQHVLGHTEWVGNAARELSVFAAHLFGIQLGMTDAVEANWGFTWTDTSFATPPVPLFHALLALMLGSTTCSVYTACATAHWPDEIRMSTNGLRAEGVDPAWHEPPYCPGAPSTEHGRPGRTAAALRTLRAFLDEHGELLQTSDLHVDLEVELDPRLVERQAWDSTGDPTALQQVAAVAADLLPDGLLAQPRWQVPVATERRELRPVVRAAASGPGVARELHLAAAQVEPDARSWVGYGKRIRALRRRRHDDGREIVGLFNPTASPDTARQIGGMCSQTVEVPAAHAAVIAIHADRVVEMVTTHDDAIQTSTVQD